MRAGPAAVTVGVITVLIAALLAAPAPADRGDPHRAISAADQAKARSMLLRGSDLVAGFRSSRSGDDDADPYCKALDESDLTLTGDSESPDFTAAGTLVSSTAQLYRSVADADASWRRGTSAAGVRCLRAGMRTVLREEKGRLISLRKLTFPKLAADKAVEFRAVARIGKARVHFDFVILQRLRAQAALLVSSDARLPRSQSVALAGVIAGRMRRALAGEVPQAQPAAFAGPPSPGVMIPVS